MTAELIDKAVLAEREACAVLADPGSNGVDHTEEWARGKRALCVTIAAGIRARGVVSEPRPGASVAPREMHDKLREAMEHMKFTPPLEGA